MNVEDFAAADVLPSASEASVLVSVNRDTVGVDLASWGDDGLGLEVEWLGLAWWYMMYSLKHLLIISNNWILLTSEIIPSSFSQAVRHIGCFLFSVMVVFFTGALVHHQQLLITKFLCRSFGSASWAYAVEVSCNLLL